MLVNALRAHMAEFGIIAPQGLRHVEMLTRTIAHQQERLPELARSILQTIVDQLNATMARIQEIEGRLVRWHRQSRVSRLVATVPGVGIIGASDRRDRCRPFVIPIGPRVRRLAGDDATAKFEGRQGTVGPDQQARRQIRGCALSWRATTRDGTIARMPER